MEKMIKEIDEMIKRLTEIKEELADSISLKDLPESKAALLREIYEEFKKPSKNEGLKQETDPDQQIHQKDKRENIE